MTWQPNIHSSLFINIYQTLIKSTEIEDIEAIIKAYRMYLEQITQLGVARSAVTDPCMASGQVF